MKFRTKVFLILFFLQASIGITQLFAQLSASEKKDTTSTPVDSTNFFYFYETGFPYGNFGNRIKTQNKLDAFQFYKDRQAGTGNAGGPEKNLHFQSPSNSSFRRSSNSFNYFIDTRKFYDSEKPYTKVQFILGQKQELNVGVIHAHPFGRNCNVAFGFNRMRSTGFYKRQNTNNTSVNLNGWYRSPGRRYALLSDIYWTGIDVAENGGIKDDSDFENTTQLDRQLVAVNLSAAETRQRYRGARIKQYWSFGSVLDTTIKKSDSLNLKSRIAPSWAIVHTIRFSDEKHIYGDQDPLSGFYSNVYRDTLETTDSTYLWRVENALWIERFDLNQSHTKRLFSGKIGGRFEAGELFNDTIYKHFTNIIADASFRIAAEKKWLNVFSGTAYYNVNGTNKGDFLLNTEIKSGVFKQLFEYFMSAQTSQLRPEFIYSNYSGNHFRWKNDFYQTGTSQASLGIRSAGFKQMIIASFSYYRFDSPVYFASDLLPTQYNGTVETFNAELLCRLGTKSFKTQSHITWNKLPVNSPIRLPEFIIRESIYGNFLLFKKALQLQVGVDATWFSAYYADAYNPNISQFYIQNTKEIGNYIFIDPWISIKVKPVKIFVKADHVNAGMMGRKYYLIPHYPQNDFALKFGLSWTFND